MDGVKSLDDLVLAQPRITETRESGGLWTDSRLDALRSLHLLEFSAKRTAEPVLGTRVAAYNLSFELGIVLHWVNCAATGLRPVACLELTIPNLAVGAFLCLEPGLLIIGLSDFQRPRCHPQSRSSIE